MQNKTRALPYYVLLGGSRVRLIGGPSNGVLATDQFHNAISLRLEIKTFRANIVVCLQWLRRIARHHYRIGRSFYA